MSFYKHILQLVQEHGQPVSDEVGNSRRKVIAGLSGRVNLQNESPLTTLTNINVKQAIAEICWNLNSGGNNAKKLLELGGESKLAVCNPNGELIGTVGGAIRAWPQTVYTTRTAIEHMPHDQLAEFEYRLKTDANAGNLILSCVNPISSVHASEETEISSIQCVRVGERLSTIVNIHQIEVVDRLPRVLFMMGVFAKAICQITDAGQGDLVFNIGLTHCRENNWEQLRTLLSRDEKAEVPVIRISDKLTSLADLALTSVTVENYLPHAALVKPTLVKA